MEISTEKAKQRHWHPERERERELKGQKLGTVTSFKYLGVVVSDDGSKPEDFARIAQAAAALIKLKPI